MARVLTSIMALGLTACGGAESPFRVGPLDNFEADSDLEALRERNEAIPKSNTPLIGASTDLGAEALYQPRPELLASPTDRALAIPSLDGSSADPMSLSLFDAIGIGLRQNRSLQSSYLNRITQNFSLFVAEEAFVPRFDSLDADVSVDDVDTDTSGTATLGTTLNWQTPYGSLLQVSIDNARTFTTADDVDDTGTSVLSLNLSQPLLRGFGLDIATADLRSARLGEAVNQLTLKSAIIDTITTIIAAYLNYVLQEQNVEIALRDLDRSRELLERNRIQVAAGRLAASEIVQTQLSVSNSEFALRSARNALDTARLALLNLLALDPTVQLSPTLNLDPEYLVVDLQRARAIAYQNNPGFLSQRLAVEQQRISLLVARDNLRAALNATANYSRTGEDSDVPGAVRDLPDANGEWTFGLSLSIPLDRLSLQSALASAEVGLEQAKIAEINARENLDTLVRNAVRTVEDSWESYLISQRSLELARQTLEIEQAKLDAGRSTNFEVLSQQQALLSAEVALLNSIISYLVALSALDGLLGTTLQTWRVEPNDDVPTALVPVEPLIDGAPLDTSAPARAGRIGASPQP